MISNNDYKIMWSFKLFLNMNHKCVDWVVSHFKKLLLKSFLANIIFEKSIQNFRFNENI